MSRSASVVALTVCELYSLKRESLQKIVVSWPELRSELKFTGKLISSLLLTRDALCRCLFDAVCTRGFPLPRLCAIAELGAHEQAEGQPEPTTSERPLTAASFKKVLASMAESIKPRTLDTIDEPLDSASPSKKSSLSQSIRKSFSKFRPASLSERSERSQTRVSLQVPDQRSQVAVDVAKSSWEPHTIVAQAVDSKPSSAVGRVPSPDMPVEQ